MRACATRRLKDEGIFSNAQMSPRMIRRYCRIDAESERMLESAMARLGLSARAFDRILRSAAQSQTSMPLRRYAPHRAEAVGYRSLIALTGHDVAGTESYKIEQPKSVIAPAHLSACAVDRILQVSRSRRQTLRSSDEICVTHGDKAVECRSFDSR